MASRFCSFSRPAASFLKHAAKKPNRPTAIPLPPIRRVPRELGSLQSLLPLHSAVSSARLTSRLGIDSSSRSISLGTLCNSNPGV